VQISGKGVLNNTISAFLMNKLDMVGIENHYIEKINMREQLIQHVDIIPVKVFINNIAYGHLTQDFSIEAGYVFDKPIIDFQAKNKSGLLSRASEEQLLGFGWLNSKEIKQIKIQASRINDFLTGFFAGIGLRLVQIQFDFGRVFDGEEFLIMLAGEISPETCVLFNLHDNSLFGLDLSTINLEELSNNGLGTYQEIVNRLS
jgi:phosphoribosylaminoimidazole-succinocarboxamide synthase